MSSSWEQNNTRNAASAGRGARLSSRHGRVSRREVVGFFFFFFLNVLVSRLWLAWDSFEDVEEENPTGKTESVRIRKKGTTSCTHKDV